MKKLTTEEFIKRAKLKNSSFYDYSLVEYKNSITKVKIICPIHGLFEQRPDHHLQGFSCLKCSAVKRSSSKEDFINKANLVHNHKYDYSKVDYINSTTKVKIICPIHGEFLQTPANHLQNRSCKKCFEDKVSKTNEEIISKAKTIHNNKYDYSLMNYINSTTKVKIICPTHGAFSQRMVDHLNGFGCSKCNESKGEKEIAKILTEMNVYFNREYKFKDCKNVRSLPFDFYIPSKNIAIEFQGRQHFIAVEYFGGEEALIKQQANDLIKKEYCRLNNIKLITINNIKEVRTNLKAYISL